MSDTVSQDQKIFVRESTGLVRQISGLGALGFVVSQMGLLYVFNVVAFTPSFYPTANPLAAPAVGLLLVLPIAGMYALLSIGIPRSGGDYVWVSRVFNPSIGFLSNFAFTLLSISVVGAVAPWIGEWSIGEMFYDLGIIQHNANYLNIANYLQGQDPAFWIASAFIIIAGLVVIASTRLTSNIVKYWTLISLAIGLIFVIVVLTAGVSKFESNFNALSGSNMTYDQVIAAGQSSFGAYNGVPPLISAATLYAGALGLLGYLGFNSSAYFSGEVRHNQRNQILAQIGGTALFAVFTTIIIATEYFGEGPKFVNAIAALWYNGNGTTPYPFLSGAPPLASGLSIYWTQNPALVSLFNLAFGLTAEIMNISVFFTLSRNLFAWSFDRVVPSTFAKISSRTRTPIYAVTLMVIAGLVYAYISIFNFGLLSSLFDYGTAGTFVVFLIVSVAAIFYPYRRRDIFDSSDSLSRKKIGRIPLITIFGVLSFIVSLVTIYAILLPEIGTSSFASVLAYGIIPTFVLGAVIYAISWTIRRRQGFNLSLLQREIPPE